jgi:hypothetical protein
MSMELSNESGIGDFDQAEIVNKPQKPTRLPVERSATTIDKYVFLMSPKHTTHPESDSSSSGYGSMPSSSTASTERGSVESEKALSFSVEANSCVICSSKFNSVAELMLHLEFR